MISARIKIELNKNLFLRDPEETELGRKILEHSVKMIDSIGFEHFTFKKLAKEIESTEASVYRYFENKHKLLVYLVSMYWVWIDYQLTFAIQNMPDPVMKLKRIIKIIARASAGYSETLQMPHIDETALYRIVISESSKAYLTKEVDEDNKGGFFREYKSLCNKIAGIVLEINPEYPYPHSLISTLFETAKKQVFFAQHLPSLTEAKVDGANFDQIADYLEHLAFSCVMDKRPK